MNLVDENFEFETFAGFRIAQLRRMAKRTVSDRTPRSAMILKWIVAIVAGGGFDYRALNVDFAAGRNEFKKRIRDVLPAIAGYFSADYVRRAAVVIGWQNVRKGIGEDTGTFPADDATAIEIRLQRLGHD